MSNQLVSRRAVLSHSVALASALIVPAMSVGASKRSGSPTPIHLVGSQCALILIDLQVSNSLAPLQPRRFTDVVSNGNMVAVSLRRAGGFVARTKVLLTEVTHPSVDDPLPLAPSEPEAGNFALNALPSPGDAVITKRQWGAFYGTDLDEELRRRQIRTLLIGGIATELGVESTARAAFDLGYALVFLEDAISGVSVKSHDFFMNEMFPRMGHVRQSPQILAGLAAA